MLTPSSAEKRNPRKRGIPAAGSSSSSSFSKTNSSTATGLDDAPPHLLLGMFLFKHVLPNARRVNWGPASRSWAAWSSHLRSDDNFAVVEAALAPLYSIFVFYTRKQRERRKNHHSATHTEEVREQRCLDLVSFRNFSADFGLLSFQPGMRNFNALFAMTAADKGRALGYSVLRALEETVTSKGGSADGGGGRGGENSTTGSSSRRSKTARTRRRRGAQSKTSPRRALFASAHPSPRRALLLLLFLLCLLVSLLH